MSNDPPEVLPDLTDRARSLQRHLTSYDEIEPCLENNYLVRGWLGKGALSILYGPSNSGKTFVATDLAVHVASGSEWRGNKVRSGLVIYVAGEGGDGIRNRFAAIRKERPTVQARAGLRLLSTNIDLFGPDDASALCSFMPSDEAALIVIDTMARSMGTGDENSARDVAQFVRNCDFIRKRTGAHVLIIHHSGKNAEAGARGSSALRAAVDTEIVISGRQISCAKQRDMEIPPNLYFDLQLVELGLDQEGDMVTSAVVVPAGAPAKEAKQLSGRDAVALHALDEVLKLSGAIRNNESLPQNRKVVEISEWRDRCRLNGLTNADAAQDTRRKAFARAKERLLDSDHIRVWDRFVWKVSDKD